MIPSLLDEAEVRHGDRPAVRDGTGRWTYRDLALASRVVAHRLAERGIGPGQRVLTLLPGGRAFAALLFGALSRGAVVVPAAEDSSDYQLRTLIKDAEPDAVITGAGAGANGADAGPAAGSGVPVLSAWSLLDRPPAREVTPLPPAGSRPPVPPDSPALMIYTSGSTGSPKGIVCPHDAVVWAARAIAGALGYRDTDVVHVRLPVTFDYGLYQLLLAALAGAEVVFPDRPLSAGELNLIRDHGATVVPVVPTLATVLSRLAARDRRPTSVRLLTNTGAALVGRDAERLRHAFPGAALICMYGMSECKRITIAAPDEDLGHPGTAGRALPGTRLFVVDADGRPLPAGALGEIVSAGPHVMAGYWRSPAAQAERFVAAPDGRGTAVRTGDYGHLDDAGRLYFVGRRDDIFKRRGWRTSCAEIEQAMLDVPGTRQAACVPPGPDGVLTVWAVTDRQPTEMLREIGARLGAARVPDRCVVVDQLPQTPNGKVDRAALRDSPGQVR